MYRCLEIFIPIALMHLNLKKNIVYVKNDFSFLAKVLRCFKICPGIGKPLACCGKSVMYKIKGLWVWKIRRPQVFIRDKHKNIKSLLLQ